jgi:hypothetical protein
MSETLGDKEWWLSCVGVDVNVVSVDVGGLDIVVFSGLIVLVSACEVLFSSG